MELNEKDNNRNKITLALYFFKKDNNQELFGKWGIYIGKRYKIGRKDCDINIEHPLISREHLELIFYTNDLINIRDLGSRNGTYINNAKVNPFQEIKFSSNDKLSLGDLNNKLIFIENQETNKSIFEEKLSNENNDQKVSQETKKIVNHNNYEKYDKLRHQYNRYGNRQMKVRRDYRYRYRFRPRTYHRNNFKRQQKTRDVYSENNYNSLSSKEFKSLEDNKERRNNYYTNRYKKNEELKNENTLVGTNKNEFIGKKTERNRNQSKNNNKIERKKNLEQLIKNQKIGLEKLKNKLKSIENESEEEEDDFEEIEGDEKEMDLFDLDTKKGNINQKIIFKTNKLNNLEFEVPVNEKNLKDLKNVKKIKYLVNGYLVLNVKEKKLVYE